MAEGKVDVSTILSPFTTREVCFSEENFDKLVKLTDYNVLNNEKLIIQALRLAVARRKQRNYQPLPTSFKSPRVISWAVYYLARSRCLMLASDTCSRYHVILRMCWTPIHPVYMTVQMSRLEFTSALIQNKLRSNRFMFCYLATFPIDKYIFLIN